MEEAIYVNYLAQPTAMNPVNLPYPGPVPHGRFSTQSMTPYPTMWPNAHLGNPGAGGVVGLVAMAGIGYGINFLVLLMATKMLKVKAKTGQLAGIAGILTAVNVAAGFLRGALAGGPPPMAGFGQQYY